MVKCKNCGGNVKFSPKEKGCECDNCGSLFPSDYQYFFGKKPVSEGVVLNYDNFKKNIQQIKCHSCGAQTLLSKYSMQTECPYCGNTATEVDKTTALMYIDSIIPFSFGKAEALEKFKQGVKSKFFVNKKIIRHTNQDDIKGMYINAFVFDFKCSSTYKGTLSYTKTYRDSDGKTVTKTVYKNVEGVIDNDLKNISIEANFKFSQQQLSEILPFNYSEAVKFKEDFVNGYVLEYKDAMFNDCVVKAEKIAKNTIQTEILKRYDCTKIVSLELKTNYIDKNYNYCLLPIYFISTNYKDNLHTIVMNGQTGKMGSLPISGWKVLFIILLIMGVIGLFIFSFIFNK